MSGVADQAADDFLASAYPDARQRRHAERWLGVMACQAEYAGTGQIHWWEIPALAPVQPVLTVRRLVLCAVAIAVIAWGTYVGTALSTTGAVGGYGVIILWIFFRVGSRFSEKVKHPPTVLEGEPDYPRAIRPRWPRGRGEIGDLIVGTLALGLGILPVLVRQWSVPAAELPLATPAGTYRSERIACLVKGLAWAPLGVLLGVIPSLGTGMVPEVVTTNVVMAVAWGALPYGPYSLLKFSEVVMSADWGERVRFLPLLEDAADRGVLRRAGGGYEFRDATLRARMAASGRAAIRDYADQRTRRLARTGVRAALAAYLTRKGIRRVCVDFMAGAAVGVAIGFDAFLSRHGGAVWNSGDSPNVWALVLISALIGVMGGILAAWGVLAWLLMLTASVSKMSLGRLPRLSRAARLGAMVLIAAVAVTLIAVEGTFLADLVAFVLPAAIVAACGAWACVLAFRRTHVSGRWWLRRVPDILAAATVAAGLAALIDHGLLSAVPASGLLSPVAAWGSFLLWRKMSRSGRLTVKAGADLVFALLLGGEIVVLLVWLANILGMPRAEVAAVRETLGSIGEIADLPWWAWTGAWLLLAAAALARVRWARRTHGSHEARWRKAVAALFERWRAVAVTEIAERSLTMVHIGLLVLVLVGLAAPPALTSTLSRRLSAAYTVAFQRELLEEGELAAYMAISRQLTDHPRSPVLLSLVTDVHDVSQSGDERQASVTEVENARLLGEAEALTLHLKAPPQLDPYVRAATEAAGLDTVPSEASGLVGQAGSVEKQEAKGDDTAKRVEEAADLASKVVASLISVPQLGGNEVVQVVREYLAGLIEDSPLANTFADWIARVPGAEPPPAPEAEVVPVPGRLEQAAKTELSEAFSASPDTNPVTDPLFNPDAALSRAETEDSLNAAVDIVNQARYAQEQTGPCSGCAVPDNGDNGSQPGDEKPPEEPPKDGG